MVFVSSFGVSGVIYRYVAKSFMKVSNKKVNSKYIDYFSFNYIFSNSILD